VAFGDFGGGKDQQAVAAAIERWVTAGHRVDALVTTGDNVYEDGDPLRFRGQLDEPYAKLRRTRPMWVTLGNHDVEGEHGPEQLHYLVLPPLPYAKRLPGRAAVPGRQQAR
jgi:3',5'-cyclic AMP phosphodiesterase CpdA